ncbi:MAG: glycosyltransferase family 4 protein [Scytonema hyalinum WJT4-NPBG1]|nr:glycosyltransferase family 4 protein [Scytonema hyalinum WJT4-NPBG1]
MRIGFVTPEFVTESTTYGFGGGLANYVYRVSKALVSLEQEVHVITFSETDESEFEQDGIQVHRISSRKIWSRLNRLTRYRFLDTTHWLDFSFQAYLKLKKLNKQRSFDIVQFPDYTACGIISSLFLRVPFVVRCSGYSPVWNDLTGVDRNLDVRTVEWLEWLQMRLSPHIYAPSYTLKQILAQRSKITNVQVIRTPFYLETLNWDSSIYDEYLKNKKYLLFFGRFQIHKGFHILAQALPKFLQAYPDSYAVCVGEDMATKIAPSMKEYASSLCGKNADRLIFIDRLRHAQLYPVIVGARLIVLPSLIDNLPNACLEAMGLGKPVIGTLGASFDELITDGETGFLVPVGDLDALSAKIYEAWMHPNLDDIGQAAKFKLQEFAIERTVQELLNYYEAILSNSSKTS